MDWLCPMLPFGWLCQVLLLELRLGVVPSQAAKAQSAPAGKGALFRPCSPTKAEARPRTALSAATVHTWNGPSVDAVQQPAQTTGGTPPAWATSDGDG